LCMIFLLLMMRIRLLFCDICGLIEMDVFEFVSWIMCELFVVCVFYMLGYMNVVVEGLFI